MTSFAKNHMRNHYSLMTVADTVCDGLAEIKMGGRLSRILVVVSLT